MHEQEHEELSTFLRWIQAFFCFKYRQMTFKEELRRKNIVSPFIFWKKINSYLNRVDIHVIYVKKFLTKMDIWW